MGAYHFRWLRLLVALKPLSPLISGDSPDYEDQLFKWKECGDRSKKNNLIKKH